MNLAWWLDRAGDEYAQTVAIVDGREGRAVTYRELDELADRMASALRDDAGVGPGEVVATILPDDHWHVALFFGLMKVGAVFSGLNRTLGVRKHAADVERSRARTVVVDRAQLDVARQLLETTCVEQIVVCDPEGDPQLLDLRALVADPREPVRIVARREADVAAVNFTGGTSGTAKGVIFPHGKLGLSAQICIAYGGIRSRDVNLSCVAMYHSGGIHDAVKWVMAGATNVMTGGWNADLAAELIAEHRPTWIYFWVPTMVRDLMRHPRWEELPLEGVRANLTGEKVPPELQEVLLARGMRVTNAYGMTETMPVAIFQPRFRYGEDAEVPAGSSGRPSVELNEVRLADPISGDPLELRPGAEGEVCVRGDVVTPGYYNDPERTADAVDADGFLHTRDLATMDADGCFWVGGRTDDIINTGAEKLSLLEVEEVLRTHEAVVDVACVAVAHARFGDVPAAFVVWAEPDAGEEAIAEALDAHCLAGMERWKRPRLYAKLEAIPRTAAKRTKSLPELRELVAGVEVSEADGVTVLGRSRPEGSPG